MIERSWVLIGVPVLLLAIAGRAQAAQAADDNEAQASYASIMTVAPPVGFSMSSSSSSPSSPPNVAARAIYSPMLDYNNVWTPIGHGDPLKKDPTYDYSPPVLDRVRYWAETSGPASPSKDATFNTLSNMHSELGYRSQQQAIYRNPHNNVVHKTKSDILLLGVPATKRAQFKSVEAPAAQQSQPPRNYYSQLPTVLMPPPMQTLPNGVASNNQRPSPAAQQPNYYHQHSTTGHHHQPWLSSSDSLTQESGHYVSIVPDPSSQPAVATPSTAFSANSVTNVPTRKKPWIQALLQKEVTAAHYQPAAASTMTSTTNGNINSIVSMHPSSPVFESHTQGISVAPVKVDSPTTTTTTPIMLNDIRTYRPMYTTSPPPPHHPAHPHQLSNHIFENMHTMMQWDTTTHFTPTVRPHMMPTRAPSPAWSTPPPSAVTNTRPDRQHSSLYGQSMMRPAIGPAYLIIEGHSKVKTYGNSPAGRHEPNVRPVQSTVNPVVVSVHLDAAAESRRQQADDERRFEVRHLHYRQQPSPEQREDERKLASTTTEEPVRSDDDAPAAGRPTGPPRMAGLLSLLDTSFGDFFSANEADEEAEAAGTAEERVAERTTTEEALPITGSTTAKGSADAIGELYDEATEATEGAESTGATSYTTQRPTTTSAAAESTTAATGR